MGSPCFLTINTMLSFCLARKEIQKSSNCIEFPTLTSKSKARRQWWTYHFCKNTECSLCKAIELLFNCTEPQPNVNSQLCRHFDIFRLVLWVLAHKQKCYSLLCWAGITAFSKRYKITTRYELHCIFIYLFLYCFLSKANKKFRRKTFFRWYLPRACENQTH